MYQDDIFPPRRVPTRREKIINVFTDSIIDMLYYDRKEDEDLPRGGIEEAIRAGEITVDEIIKIWSAELIEGLDLDAD